MSIEDEMHGRKDIFDYIESEFMCKVSKEITITEAEWKRAKEYKLEGMHD